MPKEPKEYFWSGTPIGENRPSRQHEQQQDEVEDHPLQDLEQEQSCGQDFSDIEQHLGHIDNEQPRYNNESIPNGFRRISDFLSMSLHTFQDKIQTAQLYINALQAASLDDKVGMDPGAVSVMPHPEMQSPVIGESEEGGDTFLLMELFIQLAHGAAAEHAYTSTVSAIRSSDICNKLDKVSEWDWATLQDPEIWKSHGKDVADATAHLPGSFD
ncbi:hypothetical protein GYMLUDRAFT_251408 [Collybiopsis luxurians FD-317 M1]|uniref:Uncharacterized protein n=1 Tax=Collybiopsis luxurians FD-317 M1 TaxID=944289 RepID=A0A0D0BCQ3_9AGAR|nr:hypothetical protein GYMLUDRAFT_251408 [Collybiopsis luxurians FD-317 M1]